MKGETILEIVSMIKQISLKQSKIEKDSYYTLIYELSSLLESKISINLSNFIRIRKTKNGQNEDFID